MRKVEVVEKRGKACPRSTRKKGRRGWEKSIELITIGPELKWDLYYFVMFFNRFVLLFQKPKGKKRKKKEEERRKKKKTKEK